MHSKVTQNQNSFTENATYKDSIYAQKQVLTPTFKELFMFITKITVKESMHEKQSMSCNHLDKIIEDAKPFRILATVNINK